MERLFPIGKWLRAVFYLSSAFTLLAVATSTAPAQVTLVPPFVGTYSETWERFGVSDIPNGTLILGGIATISGTNIVTLKSIVLCTVLGKPSDGAVFMFSDRPSGPLTISFSQPVSAFGAYWGSGINCPHCCPFGDAPSLLTFKDVNGNVVGNDSFFYKGDGTLMWRGYQFSTPVKTIIRVAGDGLEGIGMDGLQAIVALGGPPLNLGNISTRGLVETGDQVLIGGFIIGGAAPKQVLIRAIGPSLANFNVVGPMQDPMLSLHDTSSEIASNDDWQSASNSGQIPANLQPQDVRESAILITLPPGQYTAIVSGKGGTTGVALVEIYDLDPNSGSTLANISTRSFVGTGDSVMIGGFVGGTSNGTGQVLIRAIGPSLSGSGVANPLSDPVLGLFDANGNQINSNDNWKDTEQAQIMGTGLAPMNDLESAILTALTAGPYTAIVSDKNGGTGVALVEVFPVP
jgi:hypothetical protein